MTTSTRTCVVSPVCCVCYFSHPEKSTLKSVSVVFIPIGNREVLCAVVLPTTPRSDRLCNDDIDSHLRCQPRMLCVLLQPSGKVNAKVSIGCVYSNWQP